MCSGLLLKLLNERRVCVDYLLLCCNALQNVCLLRKYAESQTTEHLYTQLLWMQADVKMKETCKYVAAPQTARHHNGTEGGTYLGRARKRYACLFYL